MDRSIDYFPEIKSSLGRFINSCLLRAPSSFVSIWRLHCHTLIPIYIASPEVQTDGKLIVPPYVQLSINLMLHLSAIPSRRTLSSLALLKIRIYCSVHGKTYIVALTKNYIAIISVFEFVS